MKHSKAIDELLTPAQNKYYDFFKKKINRFVIATAWVLALITIAFTCCTIVSCSAENETIKAKALSSLCNSDRYSCWMLLYK